ncbi:hypothetical protein F7725_002823 [Dissostichus mawsoni]|uniref:Uncharacterized protein n=1 Tax=Dissostichus mawsoni TaxID=36200 RepID=A0A7J5Y8L5_DISMA|nr:hypothetical protein F7725_002823 [Dissostichus mawsoni]
MLRLCPTELLTAGWCGFRILKNLRSQLLPTRCQSQRKRLEKNKCDHDAVIYGYNLTVSYAGEGGEGVSKSRVRRRLPSFPLPHPALRCLVKPQKGGRGGRPTKRVLARSPEVGGVWLQRCYEVAAPVWVPRSLGGGLSIRLPFAPPVWPGAAVPTPQTRWTLVDLQAFAGTKT